MIRRIVSLLLALQIVAAGVPVRAMLAPHSGAGAAAPAPAARAAQARARAPAPGEPCWCGGGAAAGPGRAWAPKAGAWARAGVKPVWGGWGAAADPPPIDNGLCIPGSGGERPPAVAGDHPLVSPPPLAIELGDFEVVRPFPASAQ